MQGLSQQGGASGPRDLLESGQTRLSWFEGSSCRLDTDFHNGQVGVQSLHEVALPVTVSLKFKLSHGRDRSHFPLLPQI